jgi:toxin-antitoxin system PIN domain toxin
VRALLDVNMLVALSDPEHIHHSRAFAWWNEHQDEGWASCPLTQNGFVRVISGAGYKKPRRLADALAQLSGLVALPSHVFWLDDLSLADPAVFDHGHLLGPNQITDAYLLALAVKNGGRLVTFDRSVALRAVRGAQAQHGVMLG